ERDYPGRFVGLAHVPALDPRTAAAELKRCAVELGFPGVVIASELQGQALDAEVLRPFWKACADLGRLHPPAAASHRLAADVCGRPRADAWLGILADGGDGAHQQQSPARRAPHAEDPILPLRRRHRPLPAAHSRAAGPGEKRHRRHSASWPPAAAAVRLLPAAAIVLRLLRVVW